MATLGEITKKHRKIRDDFKTSFPFWQTASFHLSFKLGFGKDFLGPILSGQEMALIVSLPHLVHILASPPFCLTFEIFCLPTDPVKTWKEAIQYVWRQFLYWA